MSTGTNNQSNPFTRKNSSPSTPTRFIQERISIARLRKNRSKIESHDDKKTGLWPVVQRGQNVRNHVVDGSTGLRIGTFYMGS